MKVRLLKKKTVYGVTKNPGEEVDVRPEKARQWVRDSLAELVKKQLPEQGKETAKNNNDGGAPSKKKRGRGKQQSK